jgi:Porphyromonas-type peptidyl-arginine deiminase
VPARHPWHCISFQPYIRPVVQEYLGLKKVIWFWRGICGDDAVVNGHVDNFCCFAEPGKVMLAWTDDEMDPQVRERTSALFLELFCFMFCVALTCTPCSAQQQALSYMLAGAACSLVPQPGLSAADDMPEDNNFNLHIPAPRYAQWAVHAAISELQQLHSK